MARRRIMVGRDGVDWLQRDVNGLADLTIYQSQYGYSTRCMNRYRLTSDATALSFYNPVDTAHFSPDGARRSTGRPM